MIIIIYNDNNINIYKEIIDGYFDFINNINTKYY